MKWSKMGETNALNINLWRISIYQPIFVVNYEEIGEKNLSFIFSTLYFKNKP